MFLHGQTISIRALEPSDADILYKWENNYALWDVSYTQTPFSKFVLEHFVNSAHQDIYTNKQLRLMVCKKETNEPIGMIDLFEFEPQHLRCGLGIFIQENFRRSGYAFECINLIIMYAFSKLHLRQIYVHINESNTASIALFEKLGFKKNGFKKDWHKKENNTYEGVWFLQLINIGA